MAPDRRVGPCARPCPAASDGSVPQAWAVRGGVVRALLLTWTLHWGQRPSCPSDLGCASPLLAEA